MTSIISLTRPEDFKEKVDRIEDPIKTFDLRWSFSTDPYIKLKALDNDEDVIYEIDLDHKRREAKLDEIKRNLDNKNEKTSEFVYDIDVVGEIRRLHRVKDDGDMFKGKDEFESREKKRFEEEIRGRLSSEGYVQGDIRGSAKDVFVEVDH